jgi:primary-amine oxidase
MVHPLDPLTPEEISQSSKIIRENKPNAKGWIFNSVVLIEPPKSELAPRLLKNEKLDGVFPRKTFSLLIERGTGKVFETVVDLSKKKVERFDQAKDGQQPTLSPEDCFESERIVKEDEDVKARCKKLGLNDMELVTADPWLVQWKR